jgi:DNA-directed RNA polymerase specialized sigma24 family protein
MYTDIEFITALKNKDAKALAYIYRLEKKQLVYFAEKLGIGEEAEYIAGESFMKLWDKHADFDSLQAVKSFLYETTRESCLNFFKYSRKLSDTQMLFAPGPERNN